MKRLDLTGVRHGILNPIRSDGKTADGHMVWLCECECGGMVRVSAGNLRRGQYSCGCVQMGARTHGMSNSRTYSIWAGMKKRCNEKHMYYGGRGISVCNRWMTFDNFIHDMGECPKGYSIERVDVNGNYEPSNCTWIPRDEQAKNKTNTVKFEGQSVKQLCEQYGLKSTTVRYRIQHGVPISQALRAKGNRHDILGIG